VLAGAARVVAAVASEGRSSEDAFERAGVGTTGAAPRAAVRAVALGSVRWYLQLEPVVAWLLEGKAVAPLLRALLVAALHQIEHSRNPIEVTVSCAVDAARLLGQPRAARMVNALLRRFLREREAILARVRQSSEAAHAHPGWLLAALRASWPGQWTQIVAANNAHPPMVLRLDLARTTRAAYIEQLAQQGLDARPVDWWPTALVMAEPLPVALLPGFDAGLVSVQDAGAQLAAALLGARPGERVLDACAAPGGKTGAVLEAAGGDLELTALDLDEARTELIAQNLRRLRRDARLVAADLRSDLTWWDGKGFDRILLDAPCSSTGVIRRHPDIKLLRRGSDIPVFAATQRQLLGRCLGLLKPGGRLLYSTCSLLPAENEQVVLAALDANPGARLLSFDRVGVPWLVRAPGMQLLPGSSAQSDGFYYACLTVT
jgi:16S rRNA (cytosine967-C5)-methyltransferase